MKDKAVEKGMEHFNERCSEYNHRVIIGMRILIKQTLRITAKTEREIQLDNQARMVLVLKNGFLSMLNNIKEKNTLIEVGVDKQNNKIKQLQKENKDIIKIINMGIIGKTKKSQIILEDYQKTILKEIQKLKQ